MDDDKKKKEELAEEQEDFFKDLIEDDDEDELDESSDIDDGEKDEKDPESDTGKEKDPESKTDELTEEEKRRKNKDAEEARKRREAEEKQTKKDAEKQTRKEAERTNKLGGELVQFSKKYPDVDLAKLDKDKSFKKFIDGRLLGKKEFTILYEEYLEFRSEFSGKNTNEVRETHQKKKQSSSGSSVGTKQTQNLGSDVYSSDEMEKIMSKIPLMSEQEANRVMEKFDRSIDFYKKQKR